MGNIKKPLVSGLLAAAFAISGAGCAASGRLPSTVGTVPPEQTETVPNEMDISLPSERDILLPTNPRPGRLPAAGGSLLETTQRRLPQQRPGWWTAFGEGENCFFAADSVEALTEGLKQRGFSPEELDLAQFDDAFFRKNRLVIIPRAANSGSVSYTCTISGGADGYAVTVEAMMPEYGTTDMADFLLFAAVPLEAYPADLPITVNPAGAPSGGTTGLAAQ